MSARDSETLRLPPTRSKRDCLRRGIFAFLCGSECLRPHLVTASIVNFNLQNVSPLFSSVYNDLWPVTGTLSRWCVIGYPNWTQTRIGIDWGRRSAVISIATQNVWSIKGRVQGASWVFLCSTGQRRPRRRERLSSRREYKSSWRESRQFKHECQRLRSECPQLPWIINCISHEGKTF